MVLPVGFFMPLPLAMMIPFMGIQSAVMAKQFGEGFQYGKRRISAMSNEEFNKLTPKILMENANMELKSMIPSMQASITDMREFQIFIMKEFLLTIRAMIDAGLGKIIGLNPTEINDFVQQMEHFIHGHPTGHEQASAPPTIVTAPPTAGGPGPVGPGQPEPPLEASPTRITQGWLQINAQGLVLRSTRTGSGRLLTNINGKWRQIKTGSWDSMIAVARASWPKGYNEYGIHSQGFLARKYWVLKSKIPN